MLKTVWLSNIIENDLVIKNSPLSVARNNLIEIFGSDGLTFFLYEPNEIFFEQIITCAKSLKAIGVKEDDVVSIIMPNCPQALILFYAINCVGAIANMIHPLSSESEIEFFLNYTKSKIATTIDIFSEKVESSIKKSSVNKLIVSSISDALGNVKSLLTNWGWVISLKAILTTKEFFHENFFWI